MTGPTPMTTAAEINAALPCQFIDTTTGPFCTLHGGRWVKDVGQCDQRPGLALASAESGDEGQCICGARDHRGECHFGWHNPETCPHVAAQPEPEPGLRERAEQFADSISDSGHHVSVRVYEPYGPDDDQPDPIVDVWRSALSNMTTDVPGHGNTQFPLVATPPQPAGEREGLDG